MRRPVLGVLAFVAVFVSGPALRAQTQAAQTPIVYRVTFPEPEHHWLQVEVTFAGLGAAPLKARMSRSSPGRYAVHEFAKNVFSVERVQRRGTEVAHTRPDADEWDVAGHDGTVRLVYKIFGDHADGTYLGVDTTHAHLNMPATFMWAIGLEHRPMRDHVRAARRHRPGRSARSSTRRTIRNTFTAPNLQYFMDSPTELSDFVLEHVHGAEHGRHAGAVPARRALATASQADVDELAKMVQRHGARADGGLRRVPEIRAGLLHVSARLRPLGRRRRHGASQQHVDLVSRACRYTRLRGAVRRSARSRTSSSTTGTSSAFGRRARAVRFHAREHHLLSVARPKVSRSTTGRCC